MPQVWRDYSEDDMSAPKVLRLPPGVSGEDLHGTPVCRMMPQGTRAQIAMRRRGWKVGGVGSRKDVYRTLNWAKPEGAR
jgi:hypothetical protein